MTQLIEWSQITKETLAGLWQGFLNYLPKIVGAGVFFVIGWFVAVGIGKFIGEILKRLKVDDVFEREKWKKSLEEAGIKLRISEFVGAIIKWILIFAFLVISLRILGVRGLEGFLTGEKGIISWLLPNLLVAAAIFIVAVIVAEFAEKFTKAALKRLEVSYADLGGMIVKWGVWVFAILTILTQLGVAKDIIHILITGFVALIVISFSISFGLGGKDLARELLEKLRSEIKK